MDTFKFWLLFLAFLADCTFGQKCSQIGFFRNPNDCKKFYRCVDLWQNGRELQIYHFDCPEGTVFDENVSVCNWPQLAAPCDGQGGGQAVVPPGTGVVPVEVAPGAGEVSTEVAPGTGVVPVEVAPGAGEVSTEVAPGTGVVPVEVAPGAGEVSTEVAPGAGEGPAEVAPGAGEGPAGVTPGSETGAAGVDDGESIVLKPSFSYQCSSEGLFPHASDCSKFWLCVDEGRQELDGQLYLCPDGYLYDDEKQRCLKQEIVTCDKKPDFVNIRFEPRGTKLKVSDLDTFFNTWGRKYVIEV